jgi:hypothetical protein
MRVGHVQLIPNSPVGRNWERLEPRDREQVSRYVPAVCTHGFQAPKNSCRVHRNRPLRVCHTDAESRAGGGTTS